MATEDEPREPTFEELFEANPETPLEHFQMGDTVSGTVVNVSGESIFVDLGGKSEGVVDTAEFLDAEGHLDVKVGDQLELKVVSVSDAVYLSKSLKVRGEKAAEVLREAYESGLPVEGKVSGVNKGGLDVDISGIRAFCPVSQIDQGFCENPEVHVGMKYAFRIQEYKERGRNLIVSRRVLLEEEQQKRARQVLEKLKAGDVMEGTVTRLMNYGAFVDIGGVEGMVHVSQMAHYRLNHPSDLLHAGQTVKVQVEQFETGADGRTRISLSMKALEPTPWDTGLAFLEGEVVRGRVQRLMDFGAFVELAPGVEGLVHVSEVSYERIAHPRKLLSEGQEVQVRILRIDPEKKRISLSIKEARDFQAPEGRADAEKAEEAKLEKGRQLTGVVESVSSRGLQLRLPGAGPGVRGFLPVEELGLPGRGTDVKKKFPPGTPVQVAVESVDGPDKVRLSHTRMKQRAQQEEYQKYKDQGNRPGGLATLGDLFKDLKLPEK
jgi:small subunit ribosomal protein S1